MKYKNNSGLKQIAIINGKKEIIPNGVVFENERAIIHPGFDQVDETTPVTFKKLIPKLVKSDSLDSMQQQIDAIQKDTQGIASLSESVALTANLSKQVSELSQKTNDLDLRDNITELVNSIATMKSESDDKFTIVMKRLEILKNAIQTIELEVDQALYGEEADATKSR